MPKERYTVRLSEPVATAVTGIAEEEDRPFAQVVDLLLAERLGLRPLKIASGGANGNAKPEAKAGAREQQDSTSVVASVPQRTFRTDFKGEKK